MVNPMVPAWYQGSPESWEGVAKDSPGMWAVEGGWFRKRMVMKPVPDAFLYYYVPWPNWKRTLPVGAYTSLWPNARGNDWTKVKPAGFNEYWRPTGYGKE